MNDLLLMGAGLYAIAFLAVGIKWPRVALALTFAVAPLQYDLSGGLPIKFSLAEINLCLTLALYTISPQLRGRRFTLGPLIYPIALYLLISIFASLEDWRGSSAAVSLLQMCIYFILAVGVFSSFKCKLGDFKLGLIALLVVSAVLATFAAVQMTGYVLGMHKNGVGGSLACAVLISAELWFSEPDARRKRFYVFAMTICGAGLVATLSRGSWLSTIVGLIFITGLRREFKWLVKGATALIPVVAGLWMLLPPESKEFATGFGTERYNINARLESIEFAKEKFQRDPILGVGVGLRKEFDATNIVWTTLAETGILGLAALLLIHVVFVKMIWTAQRIVTTADEAFSYLAIGGALVLARLTHGMVDHYWSRGSLMLAWAGAGMATRVYLMARERKRGGPTGVGGGGPRRAAAGRPRSAPLGNALPPRPARQRGGLGA